jgi:hypothetical protein
MKNSIYYYNVQPCEDFFARNSFEAQRTQSSSVYMPRPVGLNQMGSSRYNQNFKLSQSVKASSRPLSPVSHPLNEKPLFPLKNEAEVESNNQDSTEVDSDDDSIESHFDAIDELSEILGSSPRNGFSPKSAKIAPFQRPSNPVVNDVQFSIPRCFAPAPRFNEPEVDEFEESIHMDYDFEPSSF